MGRGKERATVVSPLSRWGKFLFTCFEVWFRCKAYFPVDTGLWAKLPRTEGGGGGGTPSFSATPKGSRPLGKLQHVGETWEKSKLSTFSASPVLPSLQGESLWICCEFIVNPWKCWRPHRPCIYPLSYTDMALFKTIKKSTFLVHPALLPFAFQSMARGMSQSLHAER